LDAELLNGQEKKGGQGDGGRRAKGVRDGVWRDYRGGRESVGGAGCGGVERGAGACLPACAKKPS